MLLLLLKARYISRALWWLSVLTFHRICVWYMQKFVFNFFWSFVCCGKSCHQSMAFPCLKKYFFVHVFDSHSCESMKILMSDTVYVDSRQVMVRCIQQSFNKITARQILMWLALVIYCLSICIICLCKMLLVSASRCHRGNHSIKGYNIFFLHVCKSVYCTLTQKLLQKYKDGGNRGGKYGGIHCIVLCP